MLQKLFHKALLIGISVVIGSMLNQAAFAQNQTDTIQNTLDTLASLNQGGLVRDCDSRITMYLAPGNPQTNRQVILANTRKFDLTEKYLAKDWNTITQGDQFSCTAFSVSFAITIQRNIDNFFLKKQEPLVQFNPFFVFNISKSKYADPFKSNCKFGISYIDAFLTVRDRGIPLMSKNTVRNNCSDMPTYKMLSEAGKNKIQIFQRPFCTKDNFKAILIDTPFHPICISVFLNSEYDAAMDFNSGKWTKKGNPVSNRMHAMLVVGYNDERNAFKVMDWQGSEKGDNGFLWMDYALIEDPRIVFDAFICSHGSEYLDPLVGARAGSVMDESYEKPSALENELLNSQFVNDKISFWIKSGYQTMKDQFRIDCNYVSGKQGRATFRISNRYTAEIIKDDILLSEGKAFAFTYKNIDYKFRLLEVDYRGKNILKQAAIIQFDRKKHI
ncbi:hypothetical protein [Pedobacter sp. Leaf170]|uniref:hypothetical protein n=1 Tax=Pedobacter sp. Leaf170 TaxID=2876558 RepID=UPI001E546529|nr:hypothetical protein [Pedobacter sp. Leaf170]